MTGGGPVGGALMDLRAVISFLAASSRSCTALGTFSATLGGSREDGGSGTT
jgi:hypothetical protein